MESESYPVEELLETRVSPEDASRFPRELILEPRKGPAPLDPRQASTFWVSKMTVPDKIRLAVLGNEDARSMLVSDANKVVGLAVLRNPKITESEIVNYAQWRDVCEDVLWEISKHRIWIKNYQVKLALVSNPKSPLALSIKLLDHLHDRDLRNLSRSKNISSVLARSAARLLYKRGG